MVFEPLAEPVHAGALIRAARVARGWRQGDLGRTVGCSAATISRLETRHRPNDLSLLRRAADAVGVPADALAVALGLTGQRAPTVTSDRRHRTEEDPMRRRTLLTAGTAAVPAYLLAGVDDALAVTPRPTRTQVTLDHRLAQAHNAFDQGRHAELTAALPALLGDAHHAARSRLPRDFARLSTYYALASEALAKFGRYDRARLTADRATIYGELSGSPVAIALAARQSAIVLRHTAQPHRAQRLVLSTASQLQRTGLPTVATAAAYAQLLCTSAYTAAIADHRDDALTLITEAREAARRLPERLPSTGLLAVTPAAVDLYAVGVHWALGDAGSALDAGKNLRPEQFPTAERRGRMHTDLARAWWLRARPEQTAQALHQALRVSPGEVRDRPAIRQIVTDLAARHPHTSGIRELTDALRTSRA